MISIEQCRAEDIAKMLHARCSGRGWIACCPAHPDREPSLSISTGRKSAVLLKCFAGCSYREIIAAIEDRAGMRISVNQGFHNMPVVPEAQPPNNRKWIQRFWKSCIPISRNDLAYRYLLNRGLELQNFPESLRFCPQCKVTGVDGVTYLPALIARFDDPSGKLSTCHRIYLDSEGNKAKIPSPKRILSSPARGGAIRLAEPSEILGFAEGVETAFACMQLFGVPVWAAYSAQALAAVQVPSTSKEVAIFADNDMNGVGQKSAKKLAKRLLTEGKNVKLFIPEQRGDWLDVLNDMRNNTNETATNGIIQQSAAC